MRQGAGLATRQHHADAEFLAVVVELVADGGGAADDGVDALVDVLPGLVGGEELLTLLEQGHR